MIFHPAHQIGTWREILTKGKYLLQTRARTGDQLLTKGIGIAVKISQKRQIGWLVPRRQAIRRGDVVQSLIFQNYEAGEVQAFKPAERNSVVIRIRLPRRAVHRSEQIS